MIIEILNSEGLYKCSVPIQDNAKGVYNLMKEDYIYLPFSSENVIKFNIGDYADLTGVMDESLGGKLSKIYTITEKVSPVYNKDTGGYDYELKLDAYYWKWKNKIFKYIPEGYGQEASWSLTATLDVHLNVFLRNLKSLGYNFSGVDFTYSTDDTVESKAISITYSNTNMIDALTMMAEALECEWWITENVIHFGKCEYGDAVKIELGVEADSMTPNKSEGDYATRLYVFGGKKNIPINYRPVDEQVVVNGVVQRRLMMPVDTPYLDAYPDMTEDEAIERVLIIDNIYPKRTGVISEVTSYESTVENEDGSKTTATYYRYRDVDLNFSKDYIIPNNTLGVHFESGLLNGLEFEVIYNPNGDDDKQWEIKANENYGRLLPDILIKPQDGDKYVLFGYDTSFISDELLPLAEADLKKEGQKKLELMKIDDSTFTVNLFSDYVFSDKIKNTYDVGQKINLINPAYFKDGRISRVIGWEMKLDIPWDTPIYTVGESPTYSRLGSLESKINNLTFAGKSYVGISISGGSSVYIIRVNDTTPASDNNVFSALRSLDMFHRKDITDENPYLQRFLKGADFGRFTTGMIGGSGARINENGEGEMKSLTIRDGLVVPSITFNCVDVVSGDKANTFAYGTVKSVDLDSMIVELDLLSDQAGTLHVNDICRGVFHNVEGGNVTVSDLIDSNGFYSYSGFSTSYFTPIEILENKSGSFKFRYSLQPDTTIHPVKGMNFFAYGNFADKSRQAITYETRYYTRRLKNVNTWKIDPTKNISMQEGLLDGLVIGGFEMSGYGLFSENNYFTGTQIQFTPEQEESLKGDSAYNVVLSDYNGIAILSENGEVISPYTEIVDVVSGSSDVSSGENDVVATSYRLKTRIQAFKGSQELAYTDSYGEGKFTVEIEAHGCEYVLTDGVVAISNITDTNFAYLDINVTCEGITTFVLTYKITFVRNGENPAILDLENEMFNVIRDDSGNVVGGLPLSTKAHLYMGNEELTIDNIVLSLPKGVVANASGATINVTEISQNSGDTIEVGVTAYYTYNESIYNKTAYINILKVKGGVDATMYGLFLSDSSIFKDNEGAYNPTKIRCYLKKTSGDISIFPTVLPGGISIKYSINGGEEISYSLNQDINTADIVNNIRFNLYKDQTLIDRETVFVLSNGAKGDAGVGLSGCSIRESEWVEGKEYRNDTGLEDVSIRFLDVALVQNNNLDTGWEAYICKKTHVSSSSLTYRNTDYWEQTSENVASIFLSFLLAKNAKIKFLQSNELVINDSDGNPTTVLSGTLEGDKTRLAIGSTDLDNAPFRVNEKGETWQTNAHIKGEVNATSGTFENVTVASIASKNGTFNIDKDGNTSVKDLTATGGTFKEGTFENITLKKSINTPNDKLYIDAEGKVKLKDATAVGIKVEQAIIQGNIVTHANGSSLFPIGGGTEFKDFVVYGICSGANPSALVYRSGLGYMKIPPYSGALLTTEGGPIVTEEGNILLSIYGVLYDIGNYETVGGFSEWLNSI